MNAGGVSKACKSNGLVFQDHGKRESNTLVIYPKDENNPKKFGIILDIMRYHMIAHQSSGALGEAYGLSASW